MRSPEKRERTFLSKMFRTISIYMIIALCSFFSYIMLFGDVSFTPTLPGSNVDASEDSNMNKLLNAFMGAENVTANMNISVVGNDLDANLDIDAKVNMQNFDFDVTLKTALNDTSYNIEIFKNSELDSFLHININDSLFKLDLNEISSMEEIDFSALLSSFSGGEELSSILDAVGTVIGVDLTDISMENIMTKLEIVENVSENGYRFTIYFGNLRLTLDTSEDFKNMTASVRELTVNNYKINCAIDSITLDDQNFDIDTEPAGEELDISSLLKIVENAKLDDNSYALSGDVVVKYDGKELAGSVGAKIVDTDNGVLPFVRFKTNVCGVDAYIYCIDNTVYLSVEQLNFKFDIDNISEIESILKEYDINLDVEALMAVTVAMPTFENFNIKVLENGFELSLQDEIIFDDTISLSNSNITLITKTIDENILPDLLNLTTTLTMDGTPKEVGVEISNIMIGQSTQYLSDMELNGNEAINLNTKNGMTSVQEFVDLSNFIDIFNVVKDAENLTFNIDVEIDDLLKVSGLGKFDINSMSFNLDVDVDIDGLKLNIFLYGEDMLNSKTIYATIGEKSLKLNLDEANLTELLTEFGVSMDTASALDKVSAELGVDFENIDILEILKNLTLTEIEENGVLTYTISLLASENEELTAINSNEVASNENLIDLILTYNKNTNTFGLNFAKNISGYDITLNVSDLQINASDFALTAPTGDEEDITPIFDIVENAKVENGYALSSVAIITLDDKSYQARISAQLLKRGDEYLPYISLSTEIEGVKINAYLVEEEIYLNIENLMFAVNINELDIEELTNILEEEFGLSTDAVETITIAMPALANITISGLTNGFNISLDSEIVVNDNIKLSNSDLDIVTYADNGVMVLDYIQISAQLSATDKAYSLIFKLDDIMLGEEAEGLDTFVFTDGKVTAINIDNNTVPTDDFVRVENLLKIFKEVVDAENLTFNIDVEIDDLLKVSGLGKFDINSMSFNLDVDVDIDGLKLNIFLYGEDMLNSKTIYATIGEKSLKLNLDEANLTELLTEFGVSMDTASALDKVSAELGVDFENIDILEILKNLTLTESEENGVLIYTISLLASENEELTAINSNEVTSNENLIDLILTYNKNTNTFGLNFAKNISGYDITLNVSDLQINASDFALTAPTGDEEDITPIFDIVENAKVENGYALSSVATITLDDKSYQARISAQLLKSGNEYLPYISLSTEIEGIEINAYLVEEEIYLNVENLMFAVNINELDIEELTNILEEEFNLSADAIETITIAMPALANITISGLTNGFNISLDSEIVVNDNIKLSNSDLDIATYADNGVMVLDYIQISAQLSATDKAYSLIFKLDDIMLGEEAEGLDTFVFTDGKVTAINIDNNTVPTDDFVRVENLLKIFKEVVDAENLTFNIDVEIDDLLKVNGLGKFDIKSMSFNLDVDVDIDGLKLNIFLYGEDMLNSHVVYATIGEKSLKLNLDEANLTELLTEFGVSMDTVSALDKVSAELGVDFENIDILEILKNLTLTEIEENGVLTYTISLLASENEESTAINSNEVTSNENLLDLILTYNKNTNTFGLNFAKNISGYDVTLNVSDLQINANDFTLTAPTGDEEDITPIFDIVENAKVENGYALSSVATITLDDKSYQARISAQLLKRGDEYLPYISLSTEIEGVKINAYLVEEEIYLNIENLMFAVNINELDIEELTNILEEEFGLSTDAVETITIAMPALANITISGLTNGFNISLDSEIVVNDNLKLSNSDLDIVTYADNGVMVLDYIQISAQLSATDKAYSLIFKLDDIMLGEEAEGLDTFVFTDGKVTAINIDNNTVPTDDFVRVENLLKIFKEVVDAENLTFNIDVEIDDFLKVNGLGKFDIKSMSFNLDVDVDIDGLKLNIFLYGEDMLNSHVVYATIGEKSLKLNLDESNLTELLTEFGVSMDTASALDKVSAELGVDFENIDILEILKNLTLTESEENGVLTYTISLLASENEESTAINSNEVTSNENLLDLILTYNKNTNTFGLNFAKNISGYDVTLNVADLQINASDFALTVPTGDEEDITPIFDIVENAKVENGYALSSVATITLDDKSYQARISAQLLKRGDEYLPYISLSTEIEGIEINAYLVEEEIYLNIENLMFAVNINELDIEELTNILEEEFGLSTDAVETITIAMPALADITISGLTNGFNISLDSEIVVNDNLKLSNSDLDIVTYADNGVMVLDYIQISAQLSATDKAYSLIFKLDDIMLGEEAEGLDTFVFTDGKVTAINIDNNTVPTDDFVRVENLLKIFKEVVDAENLTFNIDVEIDDLLKVSGLGKFDIKSMSFNLDVDVDIDGLKLNIFLYGEDMLNSHVVYATIGEKSLKLNLDEANLTELLTEFGVSMDTASALDEVSAELGVDFENIDILEILKNLTLTESEENGVLTYTISLLASENEELTAINSNEVTSNENLIDLVLTYNKNTNTFGLNFAKNISCYDITLNISDLQINASDFALTAPTGDEEDITPIFDIVEDIKVDDYTYAISGDLAVRYSTTSFYGDMLAMIVRKGEEYVPYVRVYTSAMNIETYIYLLDDNIYLDLQGLRLTFNLSESTIDEILTFVSDDLKLTISGMENLTATFNVILPALNSISSNWIDGGVQINIGEDLKYTETAKFADIVMQAFGESANGKIYPTKVVIGANIVDPNTDIYDSYEEWWLENEEAITKDKNFAIYLSNVAIGTNSLFMDDIVFDELGNVASLKGKDGMYSLNNFENIKGLLSLAKGLLDYLNNGSYSYTTEDITATLYKLSLNAKLGNTEFTDSNVLVELAEEINAENKAEEDRKIISTLFGGKSLKVQGDMNITTTSVSEDNTSTTTAHEASIYYNSNEYEDENTPNTSGLYITYAHDNFINSDTKFRGHIENASMSDLIAMILGITNVKLDPAILESWDLTTSFEQSTIDFSFLRELMGLNKEEGDDVVTTVDSTLLSVSNILKMLDNISFVNEDSTSSLIISIVSGEDVGNLTILFTKEIVDGVTVCSPTSISFTLGDMYANINFEYGEPADDQQTDTNSNGVQDNFEFTYNTSATHHNLSSLPEFMDIAVNTLNTKNFNFKGTVTIDIISIITMDMSIDLYANIEDVKNPYIFAQIEFVTSDIASMVFNGDFDTRMVTFEFKDNNLTFHRYSKTAESGYWKYGWLWTIADWTKVVEDSVSRNTYSSAEIMPNLTQIILDAFGVKESFLGINLPDMIIDIINSIEANPSLEETLVAFSTDETCENMTLTLDGSSLLGDDGAADMNVNLGAKQYSGYYIDDDGTQIEKTYSFIDSMTGLTIDLSSILVSLDLYSNNDADSYNTTAYQLKSSYEDNSGGIAGGRLIYTNNYYRNQYMNSVIA